MSTDIFVALNLPIDPIGARLRLRIASESNVRRFDTRIKSYKIGYGYVELEIAVRKIKGIRFDRLIRRIENGIPFGNWLALAQIPAIDEDHWIAQWTVLEMEVVS